MYKKEPAGERLSLFVHPLNLSQPVRELFFRFPFSPVIWNEVRNLFLFPVISNEVRNLSAQSGCIQMLHFVLHDSWIGGPKVFGQVPPSKDKSGMEANT